MMPLRPETKVQDISGISVEDLVKGEKISHSKTPSLRQTFSIDNRMQSTVQSFLFISSF